MKGYSIIPDRVECIETLSDMNSEIDTKGLNCCLKVNDGSINVLLHSEDKDGFVVNDGEEFDFCGKIFIQYSGGTPVIYCLYYHTL